MLGATAASAVVVQSLSADGLDDKTMWRESVACALAAERIALITGDDCNVAYTVGLLHRIGMVVINE